MDDNNKALRKDAYTLLNFGGTTDWAMDLQEFITDFNPSEKLYDDVSDWRTLSCSDPAVNNSLSDPLTRWEAAGCDNAWADFLEYWNENPAANGSTFSNEVSNYFNGQPNWECGVLVFGTTENCEPLYECDNGDDNGPAAQFIMNSIVMIYSVCESLNSKVGS